MRLLGRDTNFNAFMSYMGNVDYNGASNSASVFGICFATHINLGASSGKILWRYADTVDSMEQAKKRILTSIVESKTVAFTGVFKQKKKGYHFGKYKAF